MARKPGKSTTAPQGDVNEEAASPHRARILQAALELLTTGGRDALTTRAVAEAAGVQPPVLYRLFQDKRGLLSAVADHGFALYLSDKRHPGPTEDPVQFLRDGWARHIQFGLTYPELYLLMYADPHLTAPGCSTHRGYPGLLKQMQRIASVGGLRIPPNLAADVFHATACGVVINLLARPEEDRDTTMSQVTCEAALASILANPPEVSDSVAAAAANTLAAHLLDAGAHPQPASGAFSASEKALLLEWLARLTASATETFSTRSREHA